MGLFGDTEEEKYQRAIDMSLDFKIEQAIKLFKEYEPMALQLDSSGFHQCFSGGKDSIVQNKLMEISGVKFSKNYNNVTIDPPELVRFIKQHHSDAIWHSVGKNLCAYTVNKASGLPTRRGRWCCEIYKEQGGKGKFKAIGVRAEESKRRKGLWTQLRNEKTGPTLAAILYWTDNDIWDFIKQQNIPYCSLYDEGFKRLGCVGCPMGGKNRIAEFERWPKYKEMWRRGGRAAYDKYHGKISKRTGELYWISKFKTFDDYWAWWMEEDNVNNTDEADCQLWLW